MKHEEFLKKQADIYDQFRNAAASLRTLKPDPNIINRQGMIILALRHSPVVAEGLAEVSRKIAECVPATVYDAADIHTTLLTMDSEPNFPSSRSWDDVTDRLSDLSIVIDNFLNALVIRPSIRINFGGYLMNETSVIAKGESDEKFTALINSLHDRISAEEGINIGYPWGSHVTVVRFNAEFNSVGEINRVREIIEKAPRIETHQCRTLDLGYLRISLERVSLVSYRRWQIV